MKKNPQQLLGTFTLGHLCVDVYTWAGESGGWFYSRGDGESKPRIKIGLNYAKEEWPRVVAVLLHEALESGLCTSQKPH